MNMTVAAVMVFWWSLVWMCVVVLWNLWHVCFCSQSWCLSFFSSGFMWRRGGRICHHHQQHVYAQQCYKCTLMELYVTDTSIDGTVSRTRVRSSYLWRTAHVFTLVPKNGNSFLRAQRGRFITEYALLRTCNLLFFLVSVRLFGWRLVFLWLRRAKNINRKYTIVIYHKCLPYCIYFPLFILICYMYLNSVILGDV